MFQTALKMKLPGDGEGGKGENVLIYVCIALLGF